MGVRCTVLVSIALLLAQEGHTQFQHTQQTLSRQANPGGLAPSCVQPMEVYQFTPVCGVDDVAQLRQLATQPAAVSCGLDAILDAWVANTATSRRGICDCVQHVGYSAFKPFRCKLHPDGSMGVHGFAGLCSNQDLCNWFVPGIPPSQGNYQHGAVAENFYDSNVGTSGDGCAYMTDPAHGVQGLAQFTCEANFCPECNTIGETGRQLAGYCDGTCHYCRSYSDVVPGSDCPQFLLNTVRDFLEHCYNHTGGTVNCGTFDYYPPCNTAGGTQCKDHSPIAGMSCDALLARRGLAFCDINLGTLGFFSEHCMITCGVCACPAMQTIDCGGDIVERAQASLLEHCYEQDDAVELLGMAPYVGCMREISSSCVPMDCTNLYYDVLDHCDLDRGDCTSAECGQARVLFQQNSATCSGPQVLGNNELTLAQFDILLDAKCQGCYTPPALRTECSTIASSSDECSDACFSIIEPFNERYTANGCEAELQSLGLAGQVDRINLIHRACSKPCTGIEPPDNAIAGSCAVTLASGESCSFACEIARGYDTSTFVERGDQPVCHAGRLVTTFACLCAEGQWKNRDRCQACSAGCPDGSYQLAACGYDIEGRFTGTNDVECEQCAAGEFFDESRCVGQGAECHPCAPCTDCSTQRGMVALIPCQTHVNPQRDTVCASQYGANCAGVVAPVNGNMGTCTDPMVNNQHCELQCNSGMAVGSSPRCVGGVLVNDNGICVDVHSTQCALWSGDSFSCRACVDGLDTTYLQANSAAGGVGGRFLSMGITDCDSALQTFLSAGAMASLDLACTTDLSTMGISFPQFGSTLASICGYTCGPDAGGCESSYVAPPAGGGTSTATGHGCSPNPCENGGACVDTGAGTSTCDCADGFTGPTCGVAVGVCTSNTCCPAPAAQCIQDNPFVSHCEIREGYLDNGDGTCTDVDECASAPCSNGAACNNLRSHYTCTCAAGFAGDACALAEDPCDNRCTEDQMCDRATATCVCATGRTGSACQYVDCRAWLDDLSHSVNAVCCPGHTCTEVPTDCTPACAAVWTPFTKSCSHYLDVTAQSATRDSLLQLAATCLDTTYGPPSSPNRQAQSFMGNLRTLMGASGPCTSQFAACPTDCADAYEDLYSQGKVGLPAAMRAPYENFFQLCQRAQMPPSGGH